MIPRRWAIPAINAGLLLLSLLIVAVPAEFVFRHRYGHMLYNPRQEVLAVQQYLTLDPVIGFKWRPNVPAAAGVRFKINDIISPSLSTDEFGVINPPQAIEERVTGRAMDVIGLGDSFMEMASGEFHKRFAEKGLAYYSLAIHRQCPPQYNAILESWGAKFQAKTILYGIFENDFNECADFSSWKRSGTDWFAYHSGTWCGPPIGVGGIERFARTHARGWYAFWHVIKEKLRGVNMAIAGPGQAEIDTVASSIKAAAGWATSAHARFILVIIPSKETTIKGDTKESQAYDEIVKLTASVPIEVIDLRRKFREHPDPTSLYYVQDGHWNDRGIALAAGVILDYMEGRTK